VLYLRADWIVCCESQGARRQVFRVLVVEDEFLIAMDLAGLLQGAGFGVAGPVSSVAAALDCIHAERPDAAILDVSLRGERVTAVAEVLSAIRVPFVLASAH
jgi:DNA-binding response OmpR family regulator